MKPYLFFVLFISLFSNNLAAKEASADSIRKLMELTGAGEMGVQVMNQLLPALKNMAPAADDTFWKEFMTGVDADDLIDMTVPIYQKYLTQDDVEALNSFYSTPVGKKLIKVQPMIMQDSIMAGQQWGQNLAREVMTKYEKSKSQ